MKTPIRRERLAAWMSWVSLLTYDMAAIIGAAVCAVILRFERLRMEYLTLHALSAPVILITYLLLFYGFRLYNYQWQFAGVEMIWSVLLANIMGAIAGVLLQEHIDGMPMPRSVIIMTVVLATLFIGGHRLLLRMVATSRARKRCEHRTMGAANRNVR